jgi:hypothetical protein
VEVYNALITTPIYIYEQFGVRKLEVFPARGLGVLSIMPKGNSITISGTLVGDIESRAILPNTLLLT